MSFLWTGLHMVNHNSQEDILVLGLIFRLFPSLLWTQEEEERSLALEFCFVCLFILLLSMWRNVKHTGDITREKLAQV